MTDTRTVRLVSDHMSDRDLIRYDEWLHDKTMDEIPVPEDFPIGPMIFWVSTSLSFA